MIEVAIYDWYALEDQLPYCLMLNLLQPDEKALVVAVLCTLCNEV